MRSLFGPNRKNREEAFSNLAYELEFQRIDPTSIGLIAQLQQLELFKAGANKKLRIWLDFKIIFLTSTFLIILI